MPRTWFCLSSVCDNVCGRFYNSEMNFKLFLWVELDARPAATNTIGIRCCNFSKYLKLMISQIQILVCVV